MPAPTDPSSTAEALFADWLSKRSAGEGDDLDDVCRAHPERADELRALRREWERIHAIARRDPAGRTGDGDAQASSRAEDLRAELLARLVGCGDAAARYRVEE